MKEKLIRFMQGRYGVDALSKLLTTAALVFMVLNLVLGLIWPGNLLSSALWLCGLFCLIYAYVRMFSKNHAARYREYNLYLKQKNKFDGWVKRLKQSKEYKFFRCPGCKQLIRVPRGRGKLRITCPKCRQVFEKKS